MSSNFIFLESDNAARISGTREEARQKLIESLNSGKSFKLTFSGIKDDTYFRKNRQYSM